MDMLYWSERERERTELCVPTMNQVDAYLCKTAT